MSSFYDSLELMNNQWIDVQRKFREEKFEYNSINELKEEELFKWLFQIFDNAIHHLLVNNAALKRIYRAAKEEKCDYSRFIPKVKFVSENRMNGKDKLYYYFGVSYKEVKREAITTCLKEIRALNDDVSICEFKLKNENSLKIIDFTVDPKVPKDNDEAEKYVRYYINKYGTNDGTAVALAKIAKSIFGSSIAFDPINKADTSDEELLYKYIPFWTITDYLEMKGYDGLMFNSTVDVGGKNLVIFDIQNAYYVENSIESFNSKEYLNN